MEAVGQPVLVSAVLNVLKERFQVGSYSWEPKLIHKGFRMITM